jgi:hypothetical protein
MKLDRNIALILVCIFLAKFVAIDADGLSVLFSASNISFIKPLCEKGNSPKEAKGTVNFSKIDLYSSQVISLTGFCTSQFQFEPFSWESNFSEFFKPFNEHNSSRLSYLYLDSVYPPPRLV